MNSYYEEHKEDMSKQHKEYYQENKEAILSKQKRRTKSVKKTLDEHEQLLKKDRERLKLFCINGKVELMLGETINTNKIDMDR